MGGNVEKGRQRMMEIWKNQLFRQSLRIRYIRTTSVRPSKTRQERRKSSSDISKIGQLLPLKGEGLRRTRSPCCSRVLCTFSTYPRNGSSFLDQVNYIAISKNSLSTKSECVASQNIPRGLESASPTLSRLGVPNTMNELSGK